MARKNAIAAAIETNGSTATAEKPKRKQMPTGIRNKINAAFDALIGEDAPGSDPDAARAAKTEVLSYINGLLKQLNS